MICEIYRFCIVRFSILWLILQMNFSTTGEGCQRNGRGYQEMGEMRAERAQRLLVPVANQPVAKETLGTR